MKHCHLYSIENSLSLESLVLKLCVKVLLTNQIAGFFEMQYLKKGVRNQVGFLYVNKRQSFLQEATIVLAWVANNA